MTTFTRQRTLKNVVRASGYGLHTRDRVRLTLRPAPPDHGIVFVRIDLDEPVRLPARVECTGSATLATTLIGGCVSVSCVEHLLAAFAGLGIDNALVEVGARELPIMDGSAGPFVFLLQSAGIEAQDAPRRMIRIRKLIRHREGQAWAQLAPYSGCRFEYGVEEDATGIRACSAATVELSPTVFVREVSRARAPDCWMEGVAPATTCPDERTPRSADEVLRHQILDAIGDLYLLGHGLIGAFTGFRSGHAINRALVRRLLADPEAFDIVDAPALAIEPAADPIVQSA